MYIESKLVKIKKIDEPSVEYIEQNLSKKNILPLRWAVVDVDDTMYTVSVANLKNGR